MLMPFIHEAAPVDICKDTSLHQFSASIKNATIGLKQCFLWDDITFQFTLHPVTCAQASNLCSSSPLERGRQSARVLHLVRMLRWELLHCVVPSTWIINPVVSPYVCDSAAHRGTGWLWFDRIEKQKKKKIILHEGPQWLRWLFFNKILYTSPLRYNLLNWSRIKWKHAIIYIVKPIPLKNNYKKWLHKYLSCLSLTDLGELTLECYI